ncbi:DUF3265 domain-containing protein [Vibrio parahaemolyticus]|nr:DUF3265 domain-containing protein [Vibrio parahaemolyticus]EHH1047018.1 DUF3265 domain-containing protein [Vibrio parahaemolyticus]EHK2864562.1 DUF3265 domain-containing protein [Vibrio parahaemolyticus]EHK2867785.1 DUF3265 domain-containing protein [Vibrio parahaemolyticus]EHK9101344.1 DUF3265 domain-containing protein [Vibrio parahaemolyticus]
MVLKSDRLSAHRYNGLTNALRRIRNAWHFYHALILVIKVVCRNIVLRCSPLKRALYCPDKFGYLEL